MTLGTNFGTGSTFHEEDEKMTRESIDSVLALKANRSTVENHENRLVLIERRLTVIEDILNIR